MEISIKKVRAAFADALFKSKSIAGGAPRYGLTLIVEPGSQNAKIIMKAIKEAAKLKWPEDHEKILTNLFKKDLVCYHESSKENASGEVYSGFEGLHWLAAYNKVRPLVVDRNPKIELTERDGRPYGGCYVNATIDIYAQDHKEYGKRINATLAGVQFDSDGDSFGGSAPASADDFDDLSDTGEDDLV